MFDAGEEGGGMRREGGGGVEWGGGGGGGEGGGICLGGKLQTFLAYYLFLSEWVLGQPGKSGGSGALSA